jgi:hypothetical protein
MSQRKQASMKKRRVVLGAGDELTLSSSSSWEPTADDIGMAEEAYRREDDDGGEGREADNVCSTTSVQFPGLGHCTGDRVLVMALVALAAAMTVDLTAGAVVVKVEEYAIMIDTSRWGV